MKSLSYLLFVFSLLAANVASAQIRMPGGFPSMRSMGGSRGSGSDSARQGVERRDYSDDSLQVKVYSFNAVRPTTFDTSIRDYTTRFPISATQIYLGNEGSATRSLLFSTPTRIGWDPGFHSHDAYKLRLENVRFFNTPKPYTELGYMVATGSEQMIELLHTQNIKPYWNASFQYRLMTAPGIFRNQRNNHSNMQLASWYQSPNKRYNNYFVFLQNSINAGESGGILLDKDYLHSANYERRFIIPSYLGGDPDTRGGIFNNSFNTGRRERENFLYLRQQYDLGKKDSIVTDSTVIPLFYPRLRFEHSFRFATYNYSYLDEPNLSLHNIPDSLPVPRYYDSLYNLHVTPGDSIFLQDRWREVSNDFSIYQFPDAKNLQQFIKLGAEAQLIKGYLAKGDRSLYNIIGHGEYRNRTRNQKWDIMAFGRLYFAGFNSGDYHAYISLQRLLSQQLGTLQLGFENINRSPSFLYNQGSSFYLDTAQTFTKENTLHFFANYYLPKLAVQLRGDYFIVSNYLYMNGYKSLAQENGLFNVLRLSGYKSFHLGGHWNLHSELYLQQKAGGAEVNFPLLYTRNRLAFEGRFFRNLNVSTGLEVRYNTPYKADMYSPVLGQFFYQDTTTISNRPEVHLFFHMRVRQFKAFIRLENLNAASFAGNENNLAAVGYPTPGMVFRFGIYWVFVN